MFNVNRVPRIFRLLTNEHWIPDHAVSECLIGFFQMGALYDSVYQTAVEEEAAVRFLDSMSDRIEDNTEEYRLKWANEWFKTWHLDLKAVACREEADELWWQFELETTETAF